MFFCACLALEPADNHAREDHRSAPTARPNRPWPAPCHGPPPARATSGRSHAMRARRRPAPCPGAARTGGLRPLAWAKIAAPEDSQPYQSWPQAPDAGARGEYGGFSAVGRAAGFAAASCSSSARAARGPAGIYAPARPPRAFSGFAAQITSSLQNANAQKFLADQRCFRAISGRIRRGKRRCQQ